MNDGLEYFSLQEGQESSTSTFLLKRSTNTVADTEPMSSGTKRLLDQHGCVICQNTPSCPVCSDNEQCAMTTQTCSECPKTYCLAITSNYNDTHSDSLTNAQVGGIAGGLSALVLVIIIGLIYYLFKKVKASAQADFELGINEEMKELTGIFDNSYDYEDSRLKSDSERANRRRTMATGNEHKRMSQTSLSTVANSVLTKASNVLNIVYVPGVTSSRPAKPPTIGGTRRNTRKPAASMYSRGMSVYSKETYFSDLDNASFHGGRVAMKGSNPLLVDIHQDDYDFERNEGDDQFVLENDESDNDAETFNESGGIPLNIGIQLPGRRNIEHDIVEEEDEVDEELSSSRRASHRSSRRSSRVKPGNRFTSNYGRYVAEHGDDPRVTNDGQNSNVGNHVQRSVPTRYAALIEKKDQTNKAVAHEDTQNRNIYGVYDPQGILSNESESESSDSDEENIEFLLQNSNSNSNSNTNNNSGTFGYSSAGGTARANSSTASMHTGGHSASHNPFSSPLDGHFP